ncbi:hypothetical protein BMETH_3241_0 [methanotrophic bacterial endosymbiont of Bathymodiolus sp.]|nr:hypothetical protein BMETH_3241_0 [methanotrophic bacterial endosymbiont of Bathymodiolus sp.]
MPLRCRLLITRVLAQICLITNRVAVLVVRVSPGIYIAR